MVGRQLVVALDYALRICTNQDITHQTNEQMFSYIEGYCKLGPWICSMYISETTYQVLWL